MDHRGFLQHLRGPIIPLMAPFDEQKKLDLDSLQSWIGWLIDEGIDLMWTTYGSSHYMCLMDEEVWELNRVAAEAARGKAHFIASTDYHWSVPRCIRFIQDCADWGAAAVKLQVDWRWVQEESLVLDYYTQIARESPLPLLAYTLMVPTFSAGMSLDLLRNIIDIPEFVGLKNDSGDFYEQIRYLRVIEEEGKPFTSITGGSMESFLHAYDFGAEAFATAVGVFAPDVAVKFYQLLSAGKRAEAVQIVKDIEHPLFHMFGTLGKGNAKHWACFHTVLKEKKLFRSNTLREVLRSHTPDEEQEMLQIARQLNLI